MSEWRNWSGSVRAAPQAIARPRTQAELARLVAGARKLRVVGAGHSFMPLCETDGVLLQLCGLEGGLEFNADKTRVWAPAGWTLARFTAALWEAGVSLINQGDVNSQALAGAIGTGTHGSGAELGSLSTAARAFCVMGPDGEVRVCSASENADLYQAQRVGLGLLGVVTRIEIDVIAAYHRGETLTAMPLPAALPWASRLIHPFLVGKLLDNRRVGPAYKIFPSDRTVPFEEMEYETPREAGFAALKEAIGLIRKKGLPVAFPFEFRLVAEDDIWLSPMHAGPCASISMHQYAKMPYQREFAEIEPIFRAHGGRPHWAKRHTLSRADVDALYPNAERFRAVRTARDPDGTFFNAPLPSLVG